MAVTRRFQVFVSSTYVDLVEERREVMQALLELQCIPAGMELFPAANDDQWSLIRNVIDDCDYYMVIVGNRYGSIGPQGWSYTEAEYRYAVEKGKPVMGFVHKSPELVPSGKSEVSEDGKKKLEEFRALVQSKMCRKWDSPADLGGQVSRSLINLIREEPAVGWVRGDQVASEEASRENLALRRQVEDLQRRLETARTEAPSESRGLSQGQDPYVVTMPFTAGDFPDTSRHMVNVETTWDDLLAAVGPSLINEASDSEMRRAIISALESEATEIIRKDKRFTKVSLKEFGLSTEDFDTIKIQLRALGLITRSTRAKSVRNVQAYWTLTPYGDSHLTTLRAIRREGE